MKNSTKDYKSIFSDTIAAPATVVGKGAIGIIRISGKEALTVASKIFTPAGKDKKRKSLKSQAPYSICYGTVNEKDKSIVDDCLAAVFKAPNSYTGEDSVEFYTHSSSYIMNRVLILLGENGARMASEGEFTQRAFLNGKMDLAQAEAVADLIASENKAAHSVAINQMRGGFSKELGSLREKLLHLASLLELELDFSEEDVEFASRREIEKLIVELQKKITALTSSFSVGNAIRNGIPVAIVGAVNTGKSTLLNLLVGEERAIVSDIEGTTRDTIDDTVIIGGNLFRFTDTAGIRQTTNTVEVMGIERTYQKLQEASIVILMLDASRKNNFEASIKNVSQRINKNEQELLVVVNKVDKVATESKQKTKECSESKELQLRVSALCAKCKTKPRRIICTSLKYAKSPVAEIIGALTKYAQKLTAGAENGVLVTNARHYEALMEAQKSLAIAAQGLKDQIAPDLLAQDLRDAIEDLASITGEITSQDILSNIFSHFCIGK